MRDMISIRDLEKKEIEQLLKMAAENEAEIKKGAEPKKTGKVMATLFFEASTRTKLSFQTAALRKGLTFIDFLTETSSVKKGETFIDTIKVIDGYADVIVARHPKEGALRLAADLAMHPVINGGDGGNQHPTQTLIDLYTMKKEKGKIEGLNVSLVGDLKHARTMHSLLYALAMFGANITLIAPKGLEMEKEHLEEVKKKFGAKITVKSDLDAVGTDVLYVCRIQAERFADPLEAKRVQEQFRITSENLKGSKPDLVILHPLPKVNEIAQEVDESKNAKYFSQAHNGVPVRMAIIDYAMGK